MISPSLLGAERAAYELKFALTRELQPAILDWAKSNLASDTHADAEGSYRVTTLYYDTPAASMFHRAPGYRTTKYRVRRYGTEDLAYFERKRKRGSRVRKMRDAGHDAPAWFESERCARSLEPALWVTYQRHAFVGDGGMRLTMDGDLRAWPTDDQPLSFEFGGPFVLELKFHDALPGLFRNLVADFRLMPTTCSKYRLAMAHFIESPEVRCQTS